MNSGFPYSQGEEVEVFIVHHPLGKPREVASGKLDFRALCMTQPKICHEIATDSGSSGAPIINNKGKVIGIHNGTLLQRTNNIGTSILSILNAIQPETKALDCLDTSPQHPQDSTGFIIFVLFFDQF